MIRVIIRLCRVLFDLSSMVLGKNGVYSVVDSWLMV